MPMFLSASLSDALYSSLNLGKLKLPSLRANWPCQVDHAPLLSLLLN